MRTPFSFGVIKEVFAMKKTAGKIMRELRGSKTKQQVADDLGISFSSYVKYERDERNPSDNTKRKIAKYFGKSVESIFFN
jgi:DNA-binding XRE family transcriptional regulator